MKRGYLLITTLFTFLLMGISFGIYFQNMNLQSSQEFQRDLATIRGYWSVYGAKELNTNVSYQYHSLDTRTKIYDINATLDTSGSDYKLSWSIENSSSVQNNDLHRRTLTLVGTNPSEIQSYRFE